MSVIERPSPPSPASTCAMPAATCRFVAHLLRVFGIAARAADEHAAADASVTIAQHAPAQATRHRVTVVLEPNAATCEAFGIAATVHGCDDEVDLYPAARSGDGRLTTCHAYTTFAAAHGRPVVSDVNGQAAWWWSEHGGRGFLFIGTNLAGDLMLLRQGDPAARCDRDAMQRWGFEFERPNYLFERLAPAAGDCRRRADDWCAFAAAALERYAGTKRLPLLPGNAPGAVIVTGDDDQAAISAYETQLAALPNVPLTYFMHPGTKLDRAATRRLFDSRKVELGLHPDALDAPQCYGERLAAQASWFEQHFGYRAECVRNHGFLNDGYWRHAHAWREAGLAFSSNLPGLDGRVLNGSLLPARLLLDGDLTEHWSILTTFGDGMLFALDMPDADAAARVLRMADDIVSAQLPGILVINLHPENASRAPALHAAMLALAERGFIYWTMGECLAWFRSRDEPAADGWCRRTLRWVDARLRRPRDRARSKIEPWLPPTT